MYLEYYGLKEPPFNIIPNPRLLYFTSKHREAMNHMLYGIRERKGFVQLTGEVGAGKTTLPPGITPRGTNATQAPLTRVKHPDSKTGQGTTIEFPDIELKGIVIMRDNSAAFVNSKTLKLGDRIRDAELVEISEQFVKFNYKGEEKKYYLLR